MSVIAKFTKSTIIAALKEIRSRGWIKSHRNVHNKEGNILIDFDTRTGHNHGTKFRIRQNAIPMLYEKVMHI